MHFVLVDLAAPGLRFHTSEANGDKPEETTRETTLGFVERKSAQIGVNASFFEYSETTPYTDIIGLAASNGDVYSPFEGGNRLNYRYGINFSQDNRVSFFEADMARLPGKNTIPPIHLYNALTTCMKAVENGKPAIKNGDTKLNPQTGIGVMNDGRLLLFVVDGRNLSHSLGMTRREVGETLAAFGAKEALCMDGGGSTTLVIADPKPRIANIPVGLLDIPGSERAVGNNLAISVGGQQKP